MQLNILPPMEIGEVASNMDGIFKPSICPTGALTIRRGFIMSNSKQIFECVLGYIPDNNNIRFLIRVPGEKWKLYMGDSNPSPEMKQSIIDQIGEFV